MTSGKNTRIVEGKYRAKEWRARNVSEKRVKESSDVHSDRVDATPLARASANYPRS